MARSKIRQSDQLRQSLSYIDTLAAGITLETSSVNVQTDLNAIRSQIKRLLWDDAAGKWYDDVPTINGKKRAVRDLNFDLDALEERRFLHRRRVLTDITVPTGQNFVVLSVAASEAPPDVAAVGTGSALGAVVASLPGSTGSHSLVTVAGPDAITPKNLVVTTDGSTAELIPSDNKPILALIQAASGVIDGDTFNDTTKRVQLSFVRVNSTGDGLEAVPVGDIQGKVINYLWVRRRTLVPASLPEEAFLERPLGVGGGGADLSKILITVAGTLVYIGDGDILTRV